MERRLDRFGHPMVADHHEADLAADAGPAPAPRPAASAGSGLSKRPRSRRGIDCAAIALSCHRARPFVCRRRTSGSVRRCRRSSAGFLRQAQVWTALGLAFAAGWAFIAWMALDMAHPLVRLAMPLDTAWRSETAVAVFAMWAGMMVAMMLPSARAHGARFRHCGAPPWRARVAAGGLRGRLSARLGRLVGAWPQARNGCCRRAACSPR